jgi:hypothetical protein
MTHEHDWLAPSPFWSSNGHRQAAFFRPALFEMRSDDFMDEFLTAAAAPGAGALQKLRLPAQTGGKPNKLFQPAHGRFYLAAASLCCRETGFPDRQVQRADGEQVAFVLRKLVGGSEYGWVTASDEPGWRHLNGQARGLLAGEERLPAFPTPLPDGRRLFCGYVSTSSSETYDIPPTQLVVAGEDEPRVQELSSRFIAPLWRSGGKSLVDNLPNSVALTTSIYLLLELWEYLEAHLPAVAAAVQDGTAAPTFSGETAAVQTALFNFLNSQNYKGSLKLAAALRAVAEKAEALNAPGGGDLASLGFSQTAYGLKNSDALDDAALGQLRDKVKAALPTAGIRVAVPKLDVSSQTHYVLRFVYERPLCHSAQTQVSLPSQPFVFAPFFDADAPARPVRIPLPSDVSIAGLRKASKNVTFMMSDAMRKKMAALLGNEESFLTDKPQTNLEDSFDVAFICSFSIQIIFIVAFMLLLIFVFVFNIIFWWLAFFKICLPIPKALLPD